MKNQKIKDLEERMTAARREFQRTLKPINYETDMSKITLGTVFGAEYAGTTSGNDFSTYPHQLTVSTILGKEDANTRTPSDEEITELRKKYQRI